MLSRLRIYTLEVRGSNHGQCVDHLDLSISIKMLTHLFFPSIFFTFTFHYQIHTQ
jgi:hypothetical protein